jgi:hypothetical protein
MTKTIAALSIVGCLGLAASMAWAHAAVVIPGPRPLPTISAEHSSKIREEIRINEGRAKELDPIIARDRQARHDVELDWAVLERHAREMRSRATEFRAIANTISGKGQQDLVSFANDFDVFATRDEENARLKHEVGDRLEKNVQSEVAAHDWHLRIAQRLGEWLIANGA